MAKSVNKVTLLGNLGVDPEVRYLESGSVIAKFRLATSDSYKDKNTGQLVTQTEWHNVVIWGGLAKIAEQYLKKGDKAYIEGKLRTRNYTDQNNVTKYITEIVADNLVLLGNNEKTNLSNDSTASASANDTAIEEDDDLPF